MLRLRVHAKAVNAMRYICCTIKRVTAGGSAAAEGD
jgi:hypothetical protein